MIDSVKIIHDRLTGGAYRFLSDFFRFVGLFVFECIMEENQIATEYDAVILIKKNIPEKDIENLKKKYPGIIVWEDDTLKYRQESLEQLIAELIEQNPGDNRTEMDKVKEDLSVAGMIYSCYDLMSERNSYSYLYTNKDLVEDAKYVFLDAYEEVTNYYNKMNGDVSRYFFFFRMEIIRCINETCWYLRERKFFDTKAVLNCIQDNMAKYANYSNFNILMGMLCELDIQYHIDAESYFKIALETVKTKAYGSFCYYKLGRYYERTEENWEKAIEYYQQAHLLNGKAYRVLYKIGVYYENIKNPQRALDYYKRICVILEEKEKGNYLQEKEYEYLYKSFYRIGEITREAGQYTEAVRYYQRMIKLNKKLDEENPLYKEIYGDGERDCRMATKKRLGLVRTYENLINVYKKTGEESKISEVMRAIRNLESNQGK